MLSPHLSCADDRFPPDPRKRQQYCGNLVLKINAKLGGQHNLLFAEPGKVKLFPYENQPFMIIGADVTHPMGFNRATPSIASVVGSIDRHATRYAERSRLQGHRVEMIQVSLLTLYPFYSKIGGRKKKDSAKHLVFKWY